MSESAKYQVLQYQTLEGRRPMEQWLNELKFDRPAFAAIQTRIDRLERGLTSDWKRVGGGVFEIRVDYGPGYRIYFGRDAATLVILLCGGSKRTQSRDIRLAKQYWSDYEKRTRTSGRSV